MAKGDKIPLAITVMQMVHAIDKLNQRGVAEPERCDVAALLEPPRRPNKDCVWVMNQFYIWTQRISYSVDKRCPIFVCQLTDFGRSLLDKTAEQIMELIRGISRDTRRPVYKPITIGRPGSTVSTWHQGWEAEFDRRFDSWVAGGDLSRLATLLRGHPSRRRR